MIKNFNRSIIYLGEKIYKFEKRHCICIKLLNKERGLYRLVGGSNLLNLIMIIYIALNFVFH